MYKLFFLIFLIVNSYSSQTITAVVPKYFPPYYILDKDNNPGGYAIDVLNAVTKELNLEVDYIVKDSFSEVNDYFLEKKADVIPNSGISRERKEISIFTHSTDTFRIVAFKRSTESINSLNDIKDRKVIVVRSNIGENLMKDHPKEQLIIEENNKNAILSLLSGKGDILVYPEVPILEMLKKLNIDDKIISFTKPLKEIKRAINVQKDNIELVQKLNLGLQKIKESGEYTKIYRKWFTTNDTVEIKKSDFNKILIIVTIILLLLAVCTFFLLRTLQLKKSLTSLKNNLDNAVEAATLGIWEWDCINNVVIWSNITYDLYGVKRGRALNLEFIESLIYKNDLELHKEKIKNSLLNKTPFSFEYRIIKNDEIRIINAIGKPIIQKNKVIKLTGVVQDITSLKEKEKELVKAQKLSQIGHYDFNITNNSFTSSDIVNEIFGVSKTYKKTFETWLDLIHEDDQEMMKKYFNEIIEEKTNFDKEYRIKDFKSGTTKWLHGLGEIIFDKKNNPIRMFGTIQNITQRKIYETEMKQALSVFENTHDGIMITNSDNKIINVNPSFSRTTGYTLEEVLNQNPSILKSFIYPNTFYKQMWKDLKTKGYWQGEITNKNKSGELYDEYLSINTIKKENGEIDSFIGIFSDISVIKQQEKMLLQQARTSAIGEMIGNIAHQWRQPLSVISIAATGINLQLEMGTNVSKDEIMETLGKINEQTQHLSKTIEDFRNFFSENLSNIIEFEMAEVVEKVDNLVKDSFLNNFIEVIYDIDKDIYIEGNKNLLIQALINIYNNALDALKQNNKNKKKFLFVSVTKEESKIVIRLKDNGGGVPNEYIEKIFDPYFTTKHESQGTGIGLYMTHQIVVKQFKGSISVLNSTYEYENKMYKGACFKIML